MVKYNINDRAIEGLYFEGLSLEENLKIAITSEDIKNAALTKNRLSMDYINSTCEKI